MIRIAWISAVLFVITASALSYEKTVATYPWLFDKGTNTAHETAIKTLGEIASKNGYSVMNQASAASKYKALHLPMLAAVGGPTIKQLAKFGKEAGVDYVVFGSIAWHTRSIWVGAGPKTISTATVDASVLDVATGKISYSKKHVTGRSDEKENAAKIAGAVLISPLVTAVSGGPKTPQEQRAVQIALARAFENWNKQIGK